MASRGQGHQPGRPNVTELCNGHQQSLYRRQVQDREEYDLELKLPLRTKDEIDRIPDPELTPDEQMFSADERGRRTLVKKCKLVNCFNFYTLDYLLSILSPPDRTIKNSYENVLVSHAKGIEEFYITWYHDLDKVFLMSRWLTSEMMDADFIQPVQGLVGNMVTAVYDVTGFWQRATILGVHSDVEAVTVQYVDNGVSAEVDIQKIRALPPGLMSIPPYALKCKLAGVPFTLEDDDVRREFLWEIGRTEQFYLCKLTEYNEADDQFSVELKLISGPSRPIDFNELVLNKIESGRRADKRMVKVKREAGSEADLLYSNADVEITPFSSVKMKGLKIFRVTHVNSPADFSVEYVMDYHGPVGGQNWVESMQTFYSHPSNLFRHKLASCRPLIGRCYVVKAGDYEWQRCRVIDRQEEYNTAQVLLLDLGCVMKYPFASLFELEPQFSAMCALGFKAYLADILAADGSNSWSTKSSDEFRKTACHKWFHGVVIEHHHPTESLPEDRKVNFRLGVILIEKQNEGARRITVNADLCLRKLATPNGLAAGTSLMTSDENVFDFQEMMAALTAADPSLTVEQLQLLNATEDQMHTTNVHSEEPPVPVSKGRGKRPSSAYSLETQDPAFMKYSYFRPQSAPVPTNMTQLPKQIRECMAVGSISFVASPSCFYIQMVERIPQMRQMVKYIEHQLSSTPEVPPEEIVSGLSVAVFLFDENETPTWYRGIVRITIPTISLARVILLDYGNEVAVKYGAIRLLPLHFCSIPGFATRVHLDVKNLVPKGGMPTNPVWSTEAIDSFRKYLALWQGQNPIYYLWRHPTSSIIPLDSYAQELCYNPEVGTWTKRAAGGSSAEVDLGSRKLDTKGPLLRNICRSVGIDIAYEKITDGNSVYQFARAWEILRKRGLADLPAVDAEAGTRGTKSTN